MKKSRLLGTNQACLIFLALLFAGYQAGASAASLHASADVGAFDITGAPLGFICQDSSTSGSPAQCLGTYNFSNSELNYHSTASADYGVIRFYGESSINKTAAGSSGPFAISTGAGAYFRDQWTITGGAAGTTGSLELSFDVTGTYDNSMPDTGLTTGLELWNYNLSTLTDTAGQVPPLGSSGTWSYTGVLTTPFTFGEVLDFRVAMGGGSVLLNLSEGGYDGQAAFLDLSNTAVMNAIVVKDSSGTVSPFSLSTVSGAVLFDELAPAVVPVPPAVWLFGSGLLGLVGMARRKKAA